MHARTDNHGQDRLLYPVADACQATGLSRSTLYVEMNAGRLGYVHVGQRRLIPRQALEAFVERLVNEHGPKDAA